MKKLTFSFLIMLILVGASLFRCTKEKEAGMQEREVIFSIAVPEAKTGPDSKGVSAYNLNDARKIVLTIQNADYSPTKYTSSEVNIYQMNGAFFSEKLILKTGSFRLTQFFLIDSADVIIFATPLAGSQEAQAVSSPLPLAFNVFKDISTPVSVEVLGTENESPLDFGLISFNISLPDVFDFLITVADKELDMLLSAKLTISRGNWSHFQTLDSVGSNRVTVNDTGGTGLYNITIEKSGYQTYSNFYSTDTLRLFNSLGNNTPLLIELEKYLQTGTLTDLDGNHYRTIIIGTQVWMAENLKTTLYNDSTVIPYVTENTEWAGMTTPAYCWYNNDKASFKPIYGALYNWYAVNTGKLCPSRWHIPSESEWTALTDYLSNSYEVYGTSIAKSLAAKSGWNFYTSKGRPGNEQVKNNSSGFSGYPGGEREYYFDGIGEKGIWWSSTEYPSGRDANYGSLEASWDIFLRFGAYKFLGTSVRCIKN